MVDYQDILYKVEDPVAVITMNRPDNLNAFTNRMLAELRHAMAAAEKDPKPWSASCSPVRGAGSVPGWTWAH